jgi:hypothetical protein
MAKQRRMPKSKERELEAERTYIDISCPKCPNCKTKLRMVTNPIKMKCDECGVVYTINPYTGLVINKFKSFGRPLSNIEVK